MSSADPIRSPQTRLKILRNKILLLYLIVLWNCEDNTSHGEGEIADSHPPAKRIVGLDVCVLPAAFPESKLTDRNAFGWRWLPRLEQE